MIHIEEAVIVEGKYDKIKLSNFLDAMIVETGGFAIYKDKKRLQFIRRLAMERGIIILTDSDHSGFQIRNYIAKGLPPRQVKHLYIPDVYGTALFDRLQVRYTTQLPKDPITSYDLYAAGLAGTPDSKQKKKKLLAALDLPEFLSTSALLAYLNSRMQRDEFLTYVDTI